MYQDSDFSGVFIIPIVLFIGFFIWVGWYLHPDDIQSNKRIQPDVKIEINNGVSDTTFIYKSK